MRALYMSFMIGSLAVVAFLQPPARGQNVVFDVLPLASSTVSINSGPAIVVQPGVTVPFQIVAEVINDPSAPANAGLAAFSMNVITDLSVAQPEPLRLSPGVASAFTFGQSVGTSLSDDIVNITGQQFNDLGVITTGVALNQPEVIATGELATPGFEGTFNVNVTGVANIFGLGPDASVSQTPAIMGASSGFMIQTRFSTTQPSTQPGSVPGTNNLPGTTNTNPDSDVQEVGGLNPGTRYSICGAGVEMALLFGIAGLAGLRKAWGHQSA